MNVCFAPSDVVWSSQEPDVLLFALSNSIDGRKLRLFACACARRVWPLLADERSRRAVEAAEGHADGLVSDAELERAWQGAREASLLLQAIRGRSRAPVAAARDAAQAAAAAAQADPRAGADVAAPSAPFPPARPRHGQHFPPNPHAAPALPTRL